ncbi:uncharacterized protein EAE97_004989 [Botrytis byssoidea]|uniref:Uncharacterized protein n=1 Tax=Botrytis byssoidea TaxID=139641 RepID=A0A9P5M0E1_9HELO|nr:uncharacterized protein EAE97_004989 [Botrytis byssoidea]KAF7945951.1 hypothetical protein EAE97_004989 [Botrytis byssoidea]
MVCGVINNDILDSARTSSQVNHKDDTEVGAQNQAHSGEIEQKRHEKETVICEDELQRALMKEYEDMDNNRSDAEVEVHVQAYPGEGEQQHHENATLFEKDEHNSESGKISIIPEIRTSLKCLKRKQEDVEHDAKKLEDEEREMETVLAMKIDQVSDNLTNQIEKMKWLVGKKRELQASRDRRHKS